MQLDHVVRCIEDAGYDPYEQLTGYITTGNDMYITRHGGAREIIRTLNKSEIISYLRKKSAATEKK